jgi:hypothetical protein
MGQTLPEMTRSPRPLIDDAVEKSAGTPTPRAELHDVESPSADVTFLVKKGMNVYRNEVPLEIGSFPVPVTSQP